jgi:hypothetical protein
MRPFKGLPVIALALIARYGVAQEIEFSVPEASVIPYQPIKLTNPPKQLQAPLAIPLDALERGESDVNAEANRMSENGFQIFQRVGPSDIHDRPVSVEAYLGELNQVERKINEKGQSLRSDTSLFQELRQKIDTPKFIEQLGEAAEAYRKDLEESYERERRTAALEYQKLKAVLADSTEPRKNPNAAAALYLQSRDDECKDTRRDMAGAVTCFLRNDKDEDGATNSLPTTQVDQCVARNTTLGRPVLIKEDWSDGGGDQAFGWLGSATFELKTDQYGLQVILDTKVNAMAVGQTKVIFRGHADFISPGSGEASSDRYLELFGKKVLAPPRETSSLALASSKNQSGEEQYIFHQEENIASTTMVVGFVPVVLALDAKTTAGPKYGLDMVPVKIKGQAEAVGQVTIIGSAGVGADFRLFSLLAGVKGYLDLISATIGVYPEAGLYLDSRDRPQISARMTGLSQLKTLAGQIHLGVWAKSAVGLPTPSGSFPFVEIKPVSYSWTNIIGNYPGYDLGTAVLFDKKVGYDICSGHKEEETLVAAAPRPRDLRMDFTVQEALRIEKLAKEFDQFFEQHVDSQSDREVQARLDRLEKDLSQSHLTVKAMATKILAGPDTFH